MPQRKNATVKRKAGRLDRHARQSETGNMHQAITERERRARHSRDSRLCLLRSLPDPTPAQVRQMIRLAAMFPKPTHCRRGHLYPPGGGRCRECVLAAKRKWGRENRPYFNRWNNAWKLKHGYWRTTRRKFAAAEIAMRDKLKAELGERWEQKEIK